MRLCREGDRINPHATQTPATAPAPVDLPLVAHRPSRYVTLTPAPRSITRVAVITLGCKLNQADSEEIAGDLRQRGVEVVDRPVTADAYVINTCSVTHVADRKARHMVRLARRLAPDAPVVLTGCYLQTAPPDIARQLGADAAIPTREKASIAEWLGARPRGKAAAPHPVRTRAFVKVQEGCNDVCAFCIVPKTRGREVSEPVARVVNAVRAREAQGAREVVLTGTQLGAYGRDSGASTPADVIAAVLAETSVPRLRFSSLQPQDITPALVALWQDPRLCRHFHLALQSGSDTTLRRMRRRYGVAQYRQAARRLREAIGDDVAITTDVIVGFPGETDAEFEESLAFCEEMRFGQMHVFPYSRRGGTLAAQMREQVPHATKHDRMQRMLACARESRRAYLGRFIGRVMPVLWERGRTGGDGVAWDGLTDNYIRVTARSRHELRNVIAPARLVSARDDGFDGEVVA